MPAHAKMELVICTMRLLAVHDVASDSCPSWDTHSAGITQPFQLSLFSDMCCGCAADPQSGYTIILAGNQYVFGGTSAVAPMWAAWKAATDAVAGKTLPFSAEVSKCYEN